MSLLEEARAVLAIAREEPQTAVSRAKDLIDRGDRRTRAITHFALGLAHRALANGAESTKNLEAANGLAGDDGELRGQILRSLAFNYAQAGQFTRADRTIEQSIQMLTGQEQELSRLQKAFMLLMRGEHRAALPVLDTAVAGFSATGDDDYLELTLYNRALVHMEFGDYQSSQRDLERAYEIGVRLDHPVSAADAALHLSQVLGWCDDVPGAMQWHARSVELRATAGAANPVADAEHAFVLAQARLLREAEVALRSALPRLIDAGDNQAVAVAGHLLLADVMAEKADYRAAAEAVEQAAAESSDDDRWQFDIAAARHRIRVAAGEASPELLESMLMTADDMERNGEDASATIERLRAVPVAIACGDRRALDALRSVAEQAGRRGPLWLQIQAWTALARARKAAGDARGAAAAVRAGMNRVERYRGGIGATDVRLYAGELGTELASIGLDLAVRSGSPRRVYLWSERLRGGGIRRSAVTPDIEAALADLRRTTASLRKADAESAGEAARLVRRAESRVSSLVRQLRRSTGETGTATPAEIQRQLAGQALIEYVESDGELFAVVVTTDVRLIPLGDVQPIRTTVDYLRMAAERVARPTTSASSREAALTAATDAASKLRAALLDPLAMSAARLVIIPTGVLHDVPWTLISDVPVEAAPSASSWLEACKRKRATGRSLVVQGPGLEHSEGEVDLVATATAGTITDTVAQTVKLLPEAEAVHFACHARPRTDNPMFSSLVLEDGDLTLYDIERLERVPATIVLATCAGGGTVLASGAEVVSVAGSFLAMGARTVLAPLFTVSDDATANVMEALHGATATNQSPAAALLEIRKSAPPVVGLTAGSFVCFGAS